MSSPAKVRLEHQQRCIGCYNCVFACSLELFGQVSATSTALCLKPCSLVDRFVVNICAGCDPAPCVAACTPKTLHQDRDGRLELVKPSECERCETFDCAEACITSALLIDPKTKRPILCTQCGKCAEACPHEVITYMERKR